MQGSGEIVQTCPLWSDTQGLSLCWACAQSPERTCLTSGHRTEGSETFWSVREPHTQAMQGRTRGPCKAEGPETSWSAREPHRAGYEGHAGWHSDKKCPERGNAEVGGGVLIKTVEEMDSFSQG